MILGAPDYPINLHSASEKSPERIWMPMVSEDEEIP